jgi:hypothetical protein
MKNTVSIFIFAIVLYGCSSNEKKVFKEMPDLEMEVINCILPQLIPEKSPCLVVPIDLEKKEDYDIRLKALSDKIDSIGKKIEIVSLMHKLDSNYIEGYKRMEETYSVQHLLNAPNEDRRIDSTMIRKIAGLQVLFVKEQSKTLGGSTDCYTLGQLNISRVGFNSTYTKAAFTYFISNGGCTGWTGGIIDVELKNGKWQIKK